MATGTIKTHSGTLTVQNVRWNSITLTAINEVYQKNETIPSGYRPLGIVDFGLEYPDHIYPYYWNAYLVNDGTMNVMVKVQNDSGRTQTFALWANVLLEKL